MSVVRLDADTVTIVDSVGAVRDLDTKLVDNYNIGYSFNDLDKNNVIVRFCDCGEYKKCKVLTLKEVLSCTKKAYESVYKEKDPAKLKKMVLDKNTAKRQYKNKRLKEKEVILAKEDAIIALSLLEQ